MAQARWDTSDGNPANERYRYSPLWPGSIRLLRVIPHQDETAVLQCQIFDYPLQSSEGTHLYEALSYVWGDPHQRRAISVDGQDLFVTANLHAALLRLRDRLLERIVWVDAICINQDDNEEKENQIQYMAEIYSKAYRVTVWLGEAEGDGERALEAICRAAAEPPDTAEFSIETPSAETISTEASSEALFDEPTKEAIRLLLQRPWFKRMWVLQEVAAARNILIKCGSTEIDGYAFSEALSSEPFDRFYQDSPGLKGLVRSITYLIRGAAFRPKRLPKPSCRFSLRIRSLGELIEMYCTREASERHDKVFALLGMSSDDPIAAGLSPDYGIPWEGLLERLVRYLLGEQVDVKTWPAMELAVIRSKGLILGHISSNHAGRDGRQQVAIALVDASGKLFSKIWSLPPSTESVEAGDLICLLGRATSPTIIRSQKDHFSVIMITTPPLEPTQSTSDILHDFLLLWDWEKSRESSRGRKEDTLWLGSQTVGYLDGMTASEMALISEDGGKYQKAEQEIHGIVGGHEARFGEEDTRTLTARVRLASIYLKTNRWLEAEELVQEVIQTRMRTQGTGHPDTARSRATLASIYRYRSGRYPNSQKMELFRRILERKAGEPPMTEEEVDEITRSNDIEQISLLLDQRADEIKITEAVLESVAGKCREAVMRRLLDRRGDEVRITESVLMGAAANTIDSQAMVKLLLDRGGDEVRITEAVLMKAVENEWSRTDEIVKLLLDRGGDEVEITEALLVSAVYNWRIAEELLLVLLDRGGAELKITRPVIEAAACNDFVSDGTMQLLYDRSQGSTARHRGRT